MENCYFPSVVEQDTALPGSNQADVRRRSGKMRCDGARACVLGKDLPEGAAVEGQQPILRGGDDQSRLLRVRQYRRGNRDQRGGGQSLVPRRNA